MKCRRQPNQLQETEPQAVTVTNPHHEMRADHILAIGMDTTEVDEITELVNNITLKEKPEWNL